MIMMKMALYVAERSTCARLKVGCVITSSDMLSVDGYGYNGNFAGGPNGCDSDVPGQCGCVHAEPNALVKSNYGLKNRKAFITHSPCKACSKLLINAGIREVYYIHEYRDTSPLQMLDWAGVAVYQMHETGTITRRGWVRESVES